VPTSARRALLPSRAAIYRRAPRRIAMRPVIAGIIAALLTPTPAAALDITTCGVTVPDGETGVLQADLDCSADPAENAVTLGKRSTLDMNGHAIVDRDKGVHCGSDIRSLGCAVRGSGDISGGNYGIGGASRTITVSDVSVHDVAIDGIVVNDRLVVTNVSVLRSGVNGITAGKRLTATNVIVSDNEYGGLSGENLTGTDVTANDNGYSGVTCKRCRLIRLTANGNGTEEIQVGAGGGVQGVNVMLTDSVLTGNFVDDDLVDIDSYRRPRVVNTTCDHSRQRTDPRPATERPDRPLRALRPPPGW
jgi:hypothetical protein